MAVMHHENAPLADELQRWHVSEDIWAELGRLELYALALPASPATPPLFRAGEHLYVYGRRVVPVSGLPPNSIVIERHSVPR